MNRLILNDFIEYLLAMKNLYYYIYICYILIKPTMCDDDKILLKYYYIYTT